MATNFISSNSISTTLRISASKSQVAISKAVKEATTGRLADVGGQLGALAGRDVTLRAELLDMGKIVDTNSLVGGRLDVAQERISQLIGTAESFQKDLLAARNSANGGGIIGQSASSNLQSLLTTLNVAMDGQYLFGGINTAQQPMTPYEAGSPSKTAIDAAFTATFGFPPGDVAAVNITPAAMENFLDNAFATEFADPAWGTNWSSASDQVMRSRISTTQTVDSSVSANDKAFRKLTMTYTMLSGLDLQSLNQGTFQAVTDKALLLVADSISDLASVGARLGTSQEQTTNATSRLKVQIDIVNKQVNAMEVVDPEEASVRVTSLRNQLEMSHALTAQIQNLSILNYL
ncbi:flagellar hook-associated family protein [Tardiphaga sp. P9-11]|uniref:flagellar hook-associated family protein n=1 Tax=Tardiphaga sp. P9-11 TaxID=2024614 RepID=UPI0011F3CB62|nr:flagellar hook-associated family protein [Tardiphaga sp. P9-11]KAA0078063.1 flagellar hook-associated family protein [Tardiphaga sp. P9-11]